MSSLVQLVKEQPLAVPIAVVAIVFAALVVPYLSDPHDLRRYPGPALARFTRFWLGSVARTGSRYEHMHRLHEVYGPIVRIAPDEISVADVDAIHPVLGHGTGTVKSPFYDAFVSKHRGLFNVRSRVDHTRKRKIVSSTFSQKNVLEWEPYIQAVVRNFLSKWDKLCTTGGDEYVWLDCLPWLNFLAFDVIGDLAFGEPFGMINAEADEAPVEDECGNTIKLPAVKILNDRGEFSSTQGSLPPWVRPYTKYNVFDSFFRKGSQSVQYLHGIARARVNKRLQSGCGDRKDLLARLQEGRDETGQSMGTDELTAEALTQLIAGSDTTSNSSCAILWWIVKHPRVHEKLVAELDSKLAHVDGPIDYADCKDLPYLEACINEALRRHSTSSIGLPRIMIEDTPFKGHVFKAGSVVSVPTYEIHHSRQVYGDPWTFRPERWLEPNAKSLERAFMPFSFGPRSCIGRNVAMLELQVFISTLFLRYDFKLKYPDADELPTREGFLRKPLECWIGMKQRERKLM